MNKISKNQNKIKTKYFIIIRELTYFYLFKIFFLRN